MSADLLRRAAAKLRAAAEAATQSPWVHADFGLHGTYKGCGEVFTLGDGVEGGNIAAPSGDLYPRGGYSPLEDMAYIAMMHPDVGLAVAAWLDETAKHITEFADIVGLARPGDLTEPDEAAIAAAYAILREAPDAT